MSWLAKKFPNAWRVNWKSTARRGSSWCCTPAETSWSLGRTPQPPVIEESYRAATLSDPSGAFRGPHSPLIAGLVRSQFGTKLPFVSVHDREAELMEVLTRLLSVAMLVDSLA